MRLSKLTKPLKRAHNLAALISAIWIIVGGTCERTSAQSASPEVSLPSAATEGAIGPTSVAQPAVAPLTLSDVVTRAVGNNSGIVAARQRFQEAQELVEQVNAQGRPQFSAYAQDTYTGFRTFAPSLIYPTVQNPVLPGGGSIPPVVDAAGNFPTAFIGSAGAAGASTIGASPGIATSTDMSAPAPAAASGEISSDPVPSAQQIVPAAQPTPANNVSALAVQAVVPPIVEAYVTQPSTLMSDDGSRTSELSTSVAAYPAQPRQAASPTPQADEPSAAAPQAPGSDEAPAPASSAGSSTPAERNNGYAGRVSVSQYIDLFGILNAARGAQSDVRDFYSIDIVRLQNETALVAKDLFFNLLFEQAQVNTQQEQVDYATEDVRITQDRLQQGIDSKFDVLTAQTALSTAQQQLIAADDQRDLSQSLLAYMLGTSSTAAIALATPTLPPLQQTVDLPQSIQVALTHRPELEQAESNIQAANRMVKYAESGLTPAVGIVGSGVANDGATASASKSYAEVSAELAMPLDDGGATRSRVHSAEVNVQAQNLALAQLQQNIRLEVQEAAINIRNAQAQIESAQTGVTQAQEALRLARERYQAGLGEFLDVLNALAQLASTRTSLSNAQYFYQTSLAQLVRAMGGR